jgi:hypothetical protein
VLEWPQKGAGERFAGETEYNKLALAGQDLQQTKPASEKNTIEGAPEREEYAPASVGGNYSEYFEDLDAQDGGGDELAPVDSIGKDPKPIVQQAYLAQRGGTHDLAPVDSIGKDPAPIVQQEYIRLLQDGGDLGAPVNSIGKDPKPMVQQDYIKQHDALELLQQRIHQANFKEFIANKTEEGLPPGISALRELSVVVRKPSKQ